MMVSITQSNKSCIDTFAIESEHVTIMSPKNKIVYTEFRYWSFVYRYCEKTKNVGNPGIGSPKGKPLK